MLQNLEFTLGQEVEAAGPLSPAQLSQGLEQLLKDKADNQSILDWVQVRGPPPP